MHVPLLHGPHTIITESGQVVWSAQKMGASDGVAHMGDDGRFARFDTHSGHYIFVVTMA